MWKMAPRSAPHAPPAIPQARGFTRRRLTPKMAGSVIPNAAERDEGIATDFIFAFLAFRPTARQAAPWAKFAADAMGIQVLRPFSAESMPASMTLYMWWIPHTTVSG